MITPEHRINELTKLNNDMNVEIYYVKFKDSNKKGVSYFDDNLEDFEIFISNDLKSYEEMKTLAHETGHVMTDCSTILSPQFIVERGERRAENWACQYIVKYDDIISTLEDWSIKNDFEAAQVLGVDLVSLRKAVRRYELEGRPVSRSDYVLDWRQWDY